MQITCEQTQQLLEGDYSFSVLGFSMLLTRLKGLYAKSPSKNAIDHAMSEINMFIDKYKGIMKNDFTIITNL